MIKGGYKIINFGDANFLTGKPVTVPGIYNSLKNSHRKTIMISGIKIAGVKKSDIFAYFDLSGSEYVIYAYGKTFTITNDNKVTIA